MLTLCAVVLACLCTSTDAAHPPLDPVNALAHRLKDSRHQITSIRYDYELEQTRYDSERGELQSKVEGSVVQRGSYRWTSVTRSVTLVDSSETHTASVQSVLNSAYFAYRKGGGAVQLYEHPTIEEMSPLAQTYCRANAALDFLYFGFGTGNHLLQDVITMVDTSTFWEVRQIFSSSHEPLFQLVLFSPLVTRGDLPTMLLELDPNRGNLITRVVVNDLDGNLALERVVRVETVGTGHVWLPIEMNEVVYGSFGEPQAGNIALRGKVLEAGQRSVRKLRHILLHNIEFDGDISEDHFTIQRLGLGVNERVARILHDGSLEDSLYDGEQLVSVGPATREQHHNSDLAYEHSRASIAPRSTVTIDHAPLDVDHAREGNTIIELNTPSTKKLSQNPLPLGEGRVRAVQNREIVREYRNQTPSPQPSPKGRESFETVSKGEVTCLPMPAGAFTKILWLIAGGGLLSWVIWRIRSCPTPLF